MKEMVVALCSNIGVNIQVRVILYEHLWEGIQSGNNVLKGTSMQVVSITDLRKGLAYNI